MPSICNVPLLLIPRIKPLSRSPGTIGPSFTLHPHPHLETLEQQHLDPLQKEVTVSHMAAEEEVLSVAAVVRETPGDSLALALSSRSLPPFRARTGVVLTD